MTAFFLLVFALSLPFALLGAVSRVQLYPGIPISALGFVCPLAAAAILTWRKRGGAGVAALLSRVFDWRRIRRKFWLVPVLFLMPAVTLASYGLMRVTESALAPPHLGLAGTPVLLLVVFIAALGEELGWSGYALDPMQQRWGALPAALLLGVIWAAWHIVAMVHAGQSPGWIAWGCLDMVATRVLMVWIYNGTGGSVFAVALYHAVANLSTRTIFPGGSYLGEVCISLILTAVALAVAAGRMGRRERRLVRRWLRSLAGRDVFQRRQCRVETLTLGTGHGRWTVSPPLLGPGAVAYSFGLGRDVSFERALIERFGVTVHAFDPTPLALEWLRAQSLPPSFILHDIGIADYDGSARFAPPAQSDWDSFSMVRQSGIGTAVEAPVARLATLVARIGGPPPDLVKLDIEGAEYAVVRDLLASPFRPRQLLVEFHHRWAETGPRATREAIRLLNQAGYRVAAVSDKGREYTFVLGAD